MKSASRPRGPAVSARPVLIGCLLPKESLPRHLINQLRILQQIFIFIFGLIIGSFLNAVIFRLHSGESFLFSRSHCRSCNRELTPTDLIPVLSFLFLRGRCRSCKAKLSWQYPVVELGTALVFVLLAGVHAVWVQYIFASLLIVIAVYDFKHYLILDKVVFPALGLSVLVNLIHGWHALVIGLLSGLAVSGFFLLQYWLSRGRWIGLGDVKLGLFLGRLAGWPLSILLLFLAYCLGAIAGIGLILAGRKHLGSKLPFGLFLSLSAIITMLVGQPLMAWYLKLIGL